MKSEIEQAVEYIKGSSIHNNDIYAQEALAIIEQGFIDLEEENNKHLKLIRDYVDDRTLENKLDEIRDLRNDYDPFIYEQLGIKVVRCNEIKQILDKEK